MHAVDVRFGVKCISIVVDWFVFVHRFSHRFEHQCVGDITSNKQLSSWGWVEVGVKVGMHGACCVGGVDEGGWVGAGGCGIGCSVFPCSTLTRTFNKEGLYRLLLAAVRTLDQRICISFVYLCGGIGVCLIMFTGRVVNRVWLTGSLHYTSLTMHLTFFTF